MSDVWFQHATKIFAFNGFVDDPSGILTEPLLTPPGVMLEIEPLAVDDEPWFTPKSPEGKAEVAWYSQLTTGKIPAFKLRSPCPCWVRPEEIASTLAAVDELDDAAIRQMSGMFSAPYGETDFWDFVEFLRRSLSHRGFDT